MALGPVAAGLLAAYVLLAGCMFVFQRRLIYPRAGGPPSTANESLPGIDPVTVPAHDGLRLQHWYRPPGPGTGAVVVAFHGNAGTAADRADKLRPLAAAGFGLLLVEYRGYAGNPGAPDEDSLIADGVAAVDWALNQGIASERIVIYGESLGTGVAVAVATRRRVGAVVLEAPFTSLAAVAQRHYWYLPVYPLLRDRFDSRRRIKDIGAPLLVLHGVRDPVVPLALGRRLFAAAKLPKEMVELPEGHHVDLLSHGGDAATLAFLGKQLERVPIREDRWTACSVANGHLSRSIP